MNYEVLYISILADLSYKIFRKLVAIELIDTQSTFDCTWHSLQP